MDITEEFLRDKRKEEYQYQHFQFTTSTFKNELKDMEMSIIEDAVEKMEKSLLGKYPSKAPVIQSATKKLIEEYAQKTGEWVSSIEGKLESTFIGIPSHVLLPEDKPQVKQYTKEYIEQIQAETKVLEKKLQQSKFMKVKLKEALSASEKCLEAISRVQDGPLQEESMKYLELTTNVLSDLMKINEGSNYIAEKLMDNSSSHEEVPSLQEKNLRMLKELC
ncbi:hypothetical protein J437_LFUL016058 [Ladona fulva]|uniref:Uncharacterized protein n=1 Tax=Ladona fulva TaxID=123851 RepID=A0A8K0KQ40_LADFU|nr:hypothetical protein J437_LFUL016058 [Ladona fulva]